MQTKPKTCRVFLKFGGWTKTFSHTQKGVQPRVAIILIDFRQPSPKKGQSSSWRTIPSTTNFFQVFSIGYITHGDYTPSVGFPFCHIRQRPIFFGSDQIPNCSRSGSSYFKFGQLQIGSQTKIMVLLGPPINSQKDSVLNVKTPGRSLIVTHGSNCCVIPGCVHLA